MSCAQNVGQFGAGKGRISGQKEESGAGAEAHHQFGNGGVKTEAEELQHTIVSRDVAGADLVPRQIDQSAMIDKDALCLARRA